MRSGAWRRAGALVIATGLLFASAGTALAGRAWTIDASPTSLDENDTVSVTLDVRNTGGDGGGDEIGCVVITIPSEFSIEGASVSSVKGASSGHGWVAVVSGSKVAFMEPDDSNVLVGLPQAGDSAVFWRVPRLGLDCLRARFRRHAYARHTHETYALAAILEGLRDGETRESRIVFIGRNLPEEKIRQGFEACAA